MWFFLFLNACKKYGFRYELSDYCELTLLLMPINSFENIELKFNYYCYNKIFKKAIKTMKEFRKVKNR